MTLTMKLIYGLVAACLLTTPAGAFDPPFVWVGQMILLRVHNCGGGGSGTVAIVFRPKLQAGEDNSTLSYTFGFASGIGWILRPQRQLRCQPDPGAISEKSCFRCGPGDQF